MHAATEWVCIAGETAIIARESGDVSFHALDDPESAGVDFARSMSGAGTLLSTTGLLDGAISLAFEPTDDRLGPTDDPPGARGRPNLLRYIYALAGADHTAKDTPRNLLRAAERFKEIGRPEVTAYLEMRALECVGFSYCSERIAALKPEAEIDAVQSLFPQGVDAARFLRSHSSLGSEVSHVQETIEFVAGLPAADRIRVVQATYETGLLMASGRRLESSKSEAEIRDELEEAARGALAKFEWPQHVRDAMTACVN